MVKTVNKLLKCSILLLLALEVYFNLCKNSLSSENLAQKKVYKQITLSHYKLRGIYFNNETSDENPHDHNHQISTMINKFEKLLPERELVRLTNNGLHSSNSKQKLAVIVPHKYSEAYLKTFITYMNQFLYSQSISYQIFVVETETKYAFNRGFLTNIGFLESLSRRDFNCFAIHDELLFPLDLKNQYKCDHEKPSQLASYVNNIGYGDFNGVILYTKQQFENMNGYIIDHFNDNVYLKKNVYFLKPSTTYGKYHQPLDQGSVSRFKLIRSENEYNNGLKQTVKNYTILIQQEELFTRLVIGY